MTISAAISNSPPFVDFESLFYEKASYSSWRTKFAFARDTNMAEAQSSHQPSETCLITLFLAGDVMTGRGIDQVMPHPSNPILYEPYIKDARAYVRLAEQANGPIQKPISHSYIWGDALGELKRMSPHVRIINLETSVTTSDDYWKGKGINYRTHPGNIPCITEAEIDVQSG